MLVGDSSVWVHDDTSATQRRLIGSVDGLHDYDVLGIGDDSHPEIDRFFGMRDLVSRFRAWAGSRRGGLDAPCIEAFRGRSLELDLRNVQAGRAGPAFGREPPDGYLRPVLIEDSKVGVRKVAFIRALDPHFHPELFANDDG